MSKDCIFNNKKICNDCGECDVCELNSNKKCNNCGKCLELEGYDVKAIKIDEVFEDEVTEKLEENIYNNSEIDANDALEDNTENKNASTFHFMKSIKGITRIDFKKNNPRSNNYFADKE